MSDPVKSDAWFEGLDATCDWYDGDSVAFQLDGQDLVHVSEIDEETGWATVRVFDSTHPLASVLFEGQVNVRERMGDRPDDPEEEEDL